MNRFLMDSTQKRFSLHPSQHPTFIEKKRFQIIAAAIENLEERLIDYCNDVLGWSKTNKLTENDQKALRQTLRFLQTFYKNKAIPSRIQEKRRTLATVLRTIVRNETEKPDRIDYPTWSQKTGLTKKQAAVLFQTTTVFQLSAGCSHFCRRCNEWALPGVRCHFSFEAIRTILSHMIDQGNRNCILYGASDPLDWCEKDKTIADIIQWQREADYKPTFGLLTKLPLGKAPLLADLIQSGADISVSITAKNRARITAFMNNTGHTPGIQHDSDDLLIPAGLDEDFVSVKPSITDSYGSEITPDGAFLVIPAFTSILNLTGQYRIPLNRDSRFFLEQKTGRQALPVEYFKPFQAIDISGKHFRLTRLLDVQVENIILDNGDEALTPPGMMSLEEFFSTFDKTAVERRKKMLPSIISDFKSKYFYEQKYKTASPQLRERYRSALSACILATRIDKSSILKLSAAAFFLSAIREYIDAYPEKRTIINHLKTKERIRLQENHHDLFYTTDTESILTGSSPGFFQGFQILALRLLINPEDKAIETFLIRYDSVYDTETDLFLPTHEKTRAELFCK